MAYGQHHARAAAGVAVEEVFELALGGRTEVATGTAATCNGCLGDGAIGFGAIHW